MRFAGARIVPALHGITSHYHETAPEWARLQLSSRRIADQQMASEGRDDQSVEGFRHTAGSG